MTDREQEVYGNKKTDEFIKRFTEKMDGEINCRDILGRDISDPRDLAIIRKEGLILKKCPRAINISIEILEDMLGEFLRDQAQDNINLDDMFEDSELQSVLRRTARLRRFQRSAHRLVHSSQRQIGAIQFDIRKLRLLILRILKCAKKI